ncbi:hypothetical protein C7S16_3323 [Burkholderia thailandensis]|uniref:Uncharacterized protein n=1 Tax=Burkholderia thailandensis TaxID=57975 RepID=A0AAW9D698_BURTH|nr:hypothetical protein [Burkholderia thailandensis]MDW9257559.1 hypothetical protein [Burkholderia thailandensis]
MAGQAPARSVRAWAGGNARIARTPLRFQRAVAATRPSGP